MKKIEQIIGQLQWRCQGKYRLRQYAVEYVRRCIDGAQPVQILTLWCLSKGLERRLDITGRFTPLHRERKVLGDFTWCHGALAEAGAAVNHFIFLVGSGVERGQIAPEVANNYQAMLEALVNEVSLDVLLERRAACSPDGELLHVLRDGEPPEAVAREVERRLHLASAQGIWLTKAQAYAEATKSIAVKAAEARALVREFGDFALIPLEYVERYQFHNLGVPGFTDRLLPITQPYPWRLSE